MAYVAVDKDGSESIFSDIPIRCSVFNEEWLRREDHPRSLVVQMRVDLRKGDIEKLIGRKLTWEDEPVELKDKR